MDHVDSKWFTTVWHVFPTFDFFGNDSDALCCLSNSNVVTWIDPLKRVLGCSNEHASARLSNTVSGSFQVVLDGTGLDGFAEESVAHGKIKGIHGKDFVGLSKVVDVGEEVIRELESFTKTGPVVYATSSRPSGTLVDGMLQYPVDSAEMMSESSSGLG